MIAPSVYCLTLIDAEGRQFAQAQCPLLPRFIHIHDGHDDGGEMWEASDDPFPGDEVCHVDTFARIGSAVYVIAEDGTTVESKDAVFLRVVA